MTTPMLSVQNLHVYFDVFEGEAKVLDGVNLTIETGETVALVGETGCGKSVTAKTVIGVLPIPPGRIVNGNIIYKGTNLLELDEVERHKIRGKEISMVFQDPMTFLNPVFKVGDQLTDIIKWQGRIRVGFIEYYKNRFDKERNTEAWQKAVDMLDKVKLPDPERMMENYPVELSGGMRQRVLIAMALINEPEFLIADEPGTALDVTIQEQILLLLKERVREQNISVLYITHDLGVAREVSQRIYVMYAGRVVESAPVETLFSDPKHPYTVGLLRSIPKLSGGIAEGIRGRIPDYVNPPGGCRFHPRCDHKMPICSKVRPEDIQIKPGHQVACHLFAKEE
ncbi:MAG: ATP-binding cassette domain-containing protein [Candidatus Aenigmarchaeota archaeon]|nr:ATP-binding cassette domain-containing protein [Candidatus Aenigmarchaeota archaeon]